MGRPIKLTVEYFPHDANASEGKTLSIVENLFGHEGYSVWWKLLERLSGTRNHVISIRNSEDVEFLAAKLHLQPDRLMLILSKLATLDAIDPSLFKSGTIWCQNLVDRLDPVYKSRGQPTPSRPKDELSGKETGLLVEETEFLVKQSTLTKGTKLKELKKESIKKETTPKRPYGEFQNVLLTDSEHEKLQERFGPELPRLIETLSAGMESNAKYRYKSHYAALLNWARRDGGQEHGTGNRTQARRLPVTYSEGPHYADLDGTPER